MKDSVRDVCSFLEPLRRYGKGDGNGRLVSDFIYAIEQIAVDEPEFRNYRDILAEYGINWDGREMEAYDVTVADERCIKALLVGIYRADRFSCGILERFIRNGVIIRWLERLVELSEK